MMKNSTKMSFTLMMILSTIMVTSSNNWMNMWMGMEINMMSFIVIMFNSKNNFLSQSSMMYFLTQSMASIMFIMMMMMFNFNIIKMEKTIMSNIMMMTMMIKMGSPPFHFWFPNIMNKTNWMTCMLMSTWQKVAPMYVMSQMMTDSYMMIMIIITNVITGALMGLNHTSTRMIMAYSSITHTGWMMSCMLSNKKSWLMYMALYSLLMMSVCMMMYKYNIMHINQMNLKNMYPYEKITLLIMMMSMGGMPPFLGFLPKWIALENMIHLSKMPLLMVMMMSSLLTLSYYLRLVSSTSLMSMHSQKWMLMHEKNNPTTMYMLTINMLLPVMLILVNIN
uniref:NADH dehydrogenase subunit 2 n=1 Tax=Stethoconus japonicus TaxID=1929845 RepID=UPI0022F2CF10|nr:NADH dehydrogenase subunit 2 [Stethoconus japonicus]UFQ24454.1 NADH dehydrogenase subunit 2 [Stethoconus japonicus]